jgi:hypothetical protein
MIRKLMGGMFAGALLLSGASLAQEFSKQVEEIGLKDIRYLPRTLKELGEAKGYALFFHASNCEQAVARVGDMVKLEAEYLPQGIAFAAINTGADDTIRHMAYHALVNSMTFASFKDRDGHLAAALGVETLPTVVVLDSNFKPVFKGAAAKLGEALAGYLGGGTIPDAPAAEGCAIVKASSEPMAEPITYAEHIAPFLNKHCAQCHHPGGGAPIALTSYAKAAGNAEMLAEVVGEERMPPWYAHPEFGEFRDTPQITKQEREMFAHWVAAGTPEGDAAKVPPVPEFDATAWQSDPDVIIQATQVSAVQANGFVPYQYIFLPWEAKEDTYVQSFEIKPTNPKIVHHANLIYVKDGFNVNENEDFITGYVPGGMPSVLDGERAWFIPKGAGLVFQVHLVTTGKKEVNRMQVGLRFAKGLVNKKIHYFNLDGGRRFTIPARDRAWELRDSDVLDDDATGVGMFSHMHLRGKDTQFFAHYPDGRTETLLALPNYNFDWQLTYRYPPNAFTFPKGTKIECVAHYDNSAFNPYNPDPDKEVSRGPQTVNEMLNGFFVYTKNSENLGIQVDPATGHPLKQVAAAN